MSTGILAAAVLLSVAGCTRSADQRADDLAMRNARERAQNLAQQITGIMAMRQSDDRLPPQTASDYAQVAGQDPGVQVMSVHGTYAGSGIGLVVRIEATGTDDHSGQTHDVTVCFRLAWGGGVTGSPVQGQVTCPTTPPLAIPSASVPPR